MLTAFDLYPRPLFAEPYYIYNYILAGMLIFSYEGFWETVRYLGVKMADGGLFVYVYAFPCFFAGHVDTIPVYVP